MKKAERRRKLSPRKKNKIVRRLPHTVERYQDAFSKAGFSFDLLPAPYFELNETLQRVAADWLKTRGLQKNEKWIGLAPFAMHTTKIWPLENYSQLIEKILAKTPSKFFLFGGGDKEIKYFDGLAKKFPQHCVLAAGQLKIRQEMALMKHLDIMVCVDSANMHLAAMTGVPVLSIWGGTHPDVGFSPIGKEAAVVQVTREELPCRPCSVYGRETCFVGGFPCLTRLTPEFIADQVLRKIT